MREGRPPGATRAERLGERWEGGQNRYLWDVVYRIIADDYLWGVVYRIIADDTGMRPEEIHAWCKCKFLGTQIIEVHGEKQEVVCSTTRLKKHDFFEHYVEPIRAWYAGFGGYIPDPGEVSVGDFAPDEPKE